MLVCLKCGTLFDAEALKPRAGYKDSKLCPVKDCGGTVNEVDEAIIPALRVLNKKGYKTEFSCAGHFHEECPNTYIKFKEDYSEFIKLPPEGFELEKAINNTGEFVSAIRRRHITSNKKEDQIYIMDSILYGIGQLNNWAKLLPNVYEEIKKKPLVILCTSDQATVIKDNDKYGICKISFEDTCSVDYIERHIMRLDYYDIIYVECNRKIMNDLGVSLISKGIKCANLLVDNIDEILASM